MTLSNGREASTDEAIISLLTFDLDYKMWKCLGTGFFINPVGGFVTARHVVMKAQMKPEQTLYGVQTTPTGEHHLRVTEHFVIHQDADIAIGMLGVRRLVKEDLPPENSIPFQLNFDMLNTGDQISSYAFPLTQSEELEDGQIEFTFQGKWMQGKIMEFRHDGAGKTRNRCYITDMDVDHGASGGPVLKNGRVIGINSSGIKGIYSVVTPIDLILDLNLPRKDKTPVSVKELIEGGYIFVDGFAKKEYSISENKSAYNA